MTLPIRQSKVDMDSEKFQTNSGQGGRPQHQANTSNDIFEFVIPGGECAPPKPILLQTIFSKNLNSSAAPGGKSTPPHGGGMAALPLALPPL